MEAAEAREVSQMEAAEAREAEEEKKGSQDYAVVLKLISLGRLVKDSKLEVVVSKDAAKVEAFKPTSTERAVYVSVHGRENKGKSFVLSLISNELLPSGLSQHTEGISLRYIKPVDTNKCPPLLLIDTAGASAPYKSAHKLDRLATDCFIRELALKAAHLNVVLLGFLDIEGQRSLDELAQKRDHETAKGGASTLGEIVVVHNFIGLTTVEEVEKQIQRDIIDAFGATHESGWYKSSVSGFSHYVLAQEGSEAGKRYNQRTIELLRSKALHLAAQEVHKVFSKIEDISSQLFPVYLMSDQTSAPTVNIFAKIQETQDKLTWSFTGRELRMPDDAPRLVTDFACLLGNTEAGMTLVAQTKVQVSPFLHVDRGFPTFENTLEPKMDVCVTERYQGDPGCQRLRDQVRAAGHEAHCQGLPQGAARQHGVLGSAPGQLRVRAQLSLRLGPVPHP